MEPPPSIPLLFVGALEYSPCRRGFAVLPELGLRFADRPESQFEIGAAESRFSVRVCRRFAGVTWWQWPMASLLSGKPAVVVAPIRIALGIQNKVLDAFAWDAPWCRVPRTGRPRCGSGTAAREAWGLDTTARPIANASSTLFEFHERMRRRRRRTTLASA